MSLVRKEDAAKAIVLMGAIVAVFGFAIWRILSLTGGAEPEKPVPIVLATSNTALVASANPADDGPEIDIPTLISSGAEDPFRDVVPAITVPSVVPQVRVRRPRGLRMGMGRSTFGGPELPALPFPTAEVRPLAVPEDDIRVTGVIAGDEAVAVMKIGAKDYIVKEGETVANGVEVLKIDDSSITVRASHKITKIAVGP